MAWPNAAAAYRRLCHLSSSHLRTGERFVNQLFLGSTAGPATPYGDCWLTDLHIGNGGMCFIDSVQRPTEPVNDKTVLLRCR